MAKINIAPTISIAENPEADDLVALLEVEGGASGEIFNFELDDEFADYFVIVGNELRVKEAGLFDFEAALNVFALTISATSDEGETEVDPASVTVNVTNVNEYTPTDLLFTGGTIAENTPVNGIVGVLSAVDQDRGETFTYTLVDANGAAYNDLYFTIDGNTIKLKAGLDNAQVGTHSLRVKVTDSGGLSYFEPITITVTNSAEVIDGKSGNDSKLTGTADADIINGYGGNDKLYGLAGNDTLNGGTGKDKLYGGEGQDVFVFDTPVKKGHFDHIEDFKASDDMIQISLAALKAFKVKGAKASDVNAKKSADDKGKPDDKGGKPDDKGGKPGDKGGKKSVGFDKIFTKGQKLQKKFFDIGTKTDDAGGSNDYIYYNKKSGIVYLDVDGSGKAKGIEILKVKPNTTLTADGFLFI